MILTAYWIVAGLLSLFYIYIVSRYLEGWQAIPNWQIPTHFQAKTFVTVLIPARNEAKQIRKCLESITQQEYPVTLLDIIVIDDHSTDATPNIVESFSHPSVRLLRLADYVRAGDTRSYKKKAIETGIGQAKGDLIVCTDADCTAGPLWLANLVAYYQTHQPKFIAAPVNFHQEQSTFERFQSLDFLGMMGVTGAGIYRGFMHMCNGANLAYPKKAFQEIDGFAGIDHLASGDDMLLMQKMAQRFPGELAFLKNRAARTYTTAEGQLKAFVQQRIRWASKSANYQEWQVTFILAMVFFFCSSIVLSAFLIPFFGLEMLWVFLFQVLIKALMDWWFLGTMSRFFDRSDLLRSFVPSFFMHVLYIVGIGILGNVVKQYQWKGRQVR